MISKSQLYWYLFEEPVKNQKKFGYQCFQNDFKNHMQTYLSYYPFIKSANLFHQIIPFPKQRNEETIFTHHLLIKYPEILKSISQEYNLVIMAKTPVSLPFALKNKINYLPFHTIYKYLYQGIINKNETYLQKSLNTLKSILSTFKPKFILVSQDAHPEDRLMILAAKELGIPSIEIQHGIYISSDPIVSGREADFVFVWSEFFKNLYINQKIKKNQKIKILGYPQTLTKLENNDANNKILKNVVYLGQNLEVLQDDFFKIKIDTLQKIQSICKRLDLNFFYRSHPSDNIKKIKKSSKNIQFIPKKESLNTTFNNNELFISFNSTALIEAALNRKRCLQLKNFNLKTDDFNKLGICKSLNSLEELEKQIKLIKKDYSNIIQPIDEKYIMVPLEGPGKRFLNLINEIQDNQIILE